MALVSQPFYLGIAVAFWGLFDPCCCSEVSGFELWAQIWAKSAFSLGLCLLFYTFISCRIRLGSGQLLLLC